jgi:hypothetical protein
VAGSDRANGNVAEGFGEFVDRLGMVLGQLVPMRVSDGPRLGGTRVCGVAGSCLGRWRLHPHRLDRKCFGNTN